jgi:asparagine synthetase B (glutamine-hydrolysing)
VCGIAGFAGMDLSEDDTNHRLRAMCDAIEHRGPDS